jgi:putative chitinase
MNVGLTLDSQIAYGLATAVVESNVIPAIEHRAAVGTELRKEQDEYWYTGFYGRGYVQLKLNYTYQQFSTLLKTDYYNNPDLALNPLQAARIMAYGFKNGSFTG